LCVVTPTDATPSDAVARVRAFWEALGMTVVEIPPAEHDRLLARTSHVPHLAASALALLVGESDRPFAATGFRDTTRIAAGDPPLWSAICRHNRRAILEGLDRFTEALARLRTALDQQDYHTLERLLHDAKLNRDALGS
jgi:prephenate dehydrogenase